MTEFGRGDGQPVVFTEIGSDVSVVIRIENCPRT